MASTQRYALWGTLAVALMLLPLGWFALPPCADLPQHLALSSVIWRLLHGDVALQALYQINLQPVPYYLLYVLLVPLVGLLGAALAGKVLLAGLAVALGYTGQRLLRLQQAPAVLCLALVCIFYGPVFYYGFLATLLGVPWVLTCWAALLQLAQARPQEGPAGQVESAVQAQPVVQIGRAHV